MTKAATLATFSDFRTVKGRKVCQLVFEVPIEQANEALQALGGVPSPVDPVWCGIARVQQKAANDPPRAIEKPRKRWEDLTPAQQAGIRCGENDFTFFIDEKFPARGEWESTKDFVRHYCGVESRSLIRPGTQAEQRWNLLESSYQAWLAEREYADVVR